MSDEATPEQGGVTQQKNSRLTTHMHMAEGAEPDDPEAIVLSFQ